MSKLLQIENALKAIDGATFQMLCDDYLHRRGYSAINRIGSAVGKHKTAKGTPDTYVALPNGNYIFVEYTSQESGLYGKLSSDVSKCLDEKKVKIAIDKIQEIILCHVGKLQVSQRESLNKLCLDKGCKLTVVGLDELSLDLNSKYPTLAKEYLGLDLDTGQILGVEDFVKEYGKNQMTAPLNTRFRFREEEMKKCLEALQTNDVLILTGKPGVGKSRFAIECGKRFVRKNRSFKFFCVLNQSRSLYEDLKAYFPPTGNYFILVDDANRVAEVEHIVRLLGGANPQHKIKIILTVRDYALAKVQNAVNPFATPTLFELGNFSQEHLGEFLEAEYKIRNYDFLERIWRISKGNPRLAVMAAKIVNEKKTLGSISDVSGLYDEYFSSITRDLNELNNQGLLKAAGIIAIFRSIDRTQDELFKKIADSFGISLVQLWDNLLKLHELEIVDLHENEVVRISDQVLGSYLIYKAFLKDQALKFSVIVDHFFASEDFSLNEHRLKEAIYPLFEIFDHKVLTEHLSMHIERKWEAVKDDEPKLLMMMDVFWFLRETSTLFYLHRRVESLPAENLPLNEIRFSADNSGFSKDPYLEILQHFGHSSTENFGVALDIVCRYLCKKPSLTPHVLGLLTRGFSFGRESHFRSYSIQSVLVSRLIEKSKDPTTGEFFSRILLSVAPHFLRMQFEDDWMEGAMLHRVTIYLLPEDEIFELRNALLGFLFAAYANPNLKDEVVKVLFQYTHYRHDIAVKEILESDSRLLVPFLETSLDAGRFADCELMQEYLDLLDSQSIAYKKRLKSAFQNEIYKLAELLNGKRKRLKMGWKAYEEQREKSLKAHFASYSLGHYKAFLQKCEEIRDFETKESEWYASNSSIERVLIYLSERDSALFRNVFAFILESGNPLGFLDWQLIYCLMNGQTKFRPLYRLLKSHNYQNKERFLFRFLFLVGRQSPERFYLNELLNLYRNAELKGIPADFDDLEPYQALDKSIIVTVVEIIFQRVQQENIKISLMGLFNSHSKTSKRLEELFRDRVDLLKALYFSDLISQGSDYDSRAFIQILNLDPNFIYEYIDWMYANHKYLSPHDDHRNYNFLWERDDFQNVMLGVTEHIFAQEKYSSESYLGVFFVKHAEKINEVVEERKIQFLTDYINANVGNSKKMSFIFGVIAKYYGAERKNFLKAFLACNKDYEDFKYLPLEPNSGSWSGSAVPMYEAKVEFLETLLPLMSGDAALLLHKLKIEERILAYKKTIEQTKKEEFMRFD